MEEQREILAAAVVSAWASVCLPQAEIERLRPQPGPTYRKPLSPKTLRFADDQTVAGMSALLHAIHNRGWHDRSFADWGVIGVPRFLGRTVTASNIHRSQADPAFSISPHIIPNQCLHSISGAVSVALGIHGPNFGVGGGPQAVSEGLVTGLSVVAELRIPGLWIICTEFDPEPVPEPGGQPRNAPIVHAAAMAIEGSASGISLHLYRQSSSISHAGSVKNLAAFLLHPKTEPRWQCAMDGIGVVELITTAQ